MRCRYCNTEMEHKSQDDSLDSYRYFEGRAISIRNYRICPTCRSIYEKLEWYPPKDKEKYVATEKQANTILKLLKEYKMSFWEDDDLGLIYKENRIMNKNIIILSKTEADFIIKQLLLFGVDWQDKINRYINKNIKKGFIEIDLSEQRSWLKCILRDKVNIFS